MTQNLMAIGLGLIWIGNIYSTNDIFSFYYLKLKIMKGYSGIRRAPTLYEEIVSGIIATGVAFIILWSGSSE